MNLLYEQEEIALWMVVEGNGSIQDGDGTIGHGYCSTYSTKYVRMHCISLSRLGNPNYRMSCIAIVLSSGRFILIAV